MAPNFRQYHLYILPLCIVLDDLDVVIDLYMKTPSTVDSIILNYKTGLNICFMIVASTKLQFKQLKMSDSVFWT